VGHNRIVSSVLPLAMRFPSGPECPAVDGVVVAGEWIGEGLP
jgi:hypothetical protein